MECDKEPKQLSADQRKQAVDRVRNGETKTEVAKSLGVDRRTVYNWYKAESQERKPYNSTRKFKLDAHTMTAIKNTLDDEESITWDELKEYLEISCPNTTLSTAVKRAGYKRYKKLPKSKHLDDKGIRNLRLDFCDKYKDWTADQWEQVCFLDESYHQTQAHCRNEFYHSTPESNKGKKKYGFYNKKKLKVNFLAVINGHLSRIYFFDKNCDEIVFTNLLDQRNVVYELKLYQPDTLNMFLDNAKYHRTPKVQEFFSKPECQNVKRVFLPPYSNDLNPIENLFGLMKSSQSLKSKILTVKRKEVFQNLVKETFEDLVGKGVVKQLLRSMPERIKAVMKNKGGPTKF